MSALNAKERANARGIYLILAALFIAALITCNLIANKFVELDLGFYTFTISIGILPYPFTFLITDIMSEMYGRRRTNLVVYAGFFASVFLLLILWLGSALPAISGSPVQDAEYNVVFQNSWRIISASMLAYLAAQLVDIRLFHFWKKVTKGKHLWVRNNFSTILSQFLDTFLVVTVIFIGRASTGDITQMIIDGWFFKVIIALLDTIVIYAVVAWFRKKFRLAQGQELPLED